MKKILITLAVLFLIAVTVTFVGYKYLSSNSYPLEVKTITANGYVYKFKFPANGWRRKSGYFTISRGGLAFVPHIVKKDDPCGSQGGKVAFNLRQDNGNDVEVCSGSLPENDRVFQAYVISMKSEDQQVHEIVIFGEETSVRLDELKEILASVIVLKSK